MATFPSADLELQLTCVDEELDVLRHICKACLLYLDQIGTGEFTAEDERNMRATIDKIEQASDEIFKMRVRFRLQPVPRHRSADGLTS